MKKHELTVEKRKVTGRKVKNLRKQGIMPANIYGKKVASLAVQLPFKDFRTIFNEIGETGLLDLTVVGEEKTRPVLIHNVHLDPLSSQPLHTDFFQVDLKKKVTAMVPLELGGEAPAVKDKKGVLLQTLNEIEVEALPTDLPEKITIDVSSLVEVDQEIKVGELKIPSGVTVLSDVGVGVCKIGSLVTAEMKAEIKKDEEAAAAAAEAVPPAEGETKAPTKSEKPAEGAKPSEEKSAAEPTKEN
ncbi:MAG: 50S ribosomal protein L25 [bacterium]|nr:50S ribosomal protein L25 [bacterium]